MRNRKNIKSIKIAITGGTGNVGRSLCEYLRNVGITVAPLSRHDFSLEKAPKTKTFEGIDLVVHCAHSFTTNEALSEKINVQGSINLFNAMRAMEIPVIFISSLSAHENAQSIYGRHKYIIEKFCQAHDIPILKTGLLYGENFSSTYKRIESLVSQSSLIILPSGKKCLQYLTHIDDFNSALGIIIRKVLSGENVNSLHYAIPLKPTPLRTLCKLINPKIFIIPVHWRILWAILKLLERLCIATGFSADSLLGLVYHPEESIVGRNFKFCSYNFREYKII